MSKSNTDIIDLEKELDKLIAELTENVSAKQKAKIKEAKRKWLKKNKEKIKQTKKKWKAKNKEKIKQTKKKWREKNRKRK